jgi:hypothetical protein
MGKRQGKDGLTDFQRGLVWGWFSAGLLLALMVATK